MNQLTRIAARLYNAPLLIAPTAAEGIEAVLSERLAGLGPAPARAASGSSRDDEAPAYDVADGVATISIRGELVNRGSWLDAASGLTSYEGLASALDQAAADPRVSGILLDIDSPGGEASGAMETAAKVRAVAGQKRIVAYVNSLAASAAYALAAGASEIVVPPSGVVGSIGVVWLHMDRSAALGQRGMKPTFVHAGAFKVDGHGYGALEPEAKARIQSSIDDMYALFTNSVGAHRPALGVEGARATEAGVFMGQKAVDAGLADRVGDMKTAKALLKPAARPINGTKGQTMDPKFTQAEYDAGIANATSALRNELTAVHATALAAATLQGASDERARVKAILDGDAAKGKQALARQIAFSSDMSAEAAAPILAAAAPEVAAPASRLAGVPNPALKAGGTQTTQDSPVEKQREIDASWTDVVKKLA